MAKAKLSKKVKQLINNDVMVSLAFTSLLINIFFFSGVLIFANSNSLDQNVYDAGYTNLCVKNYEENLMEAMESSSDKELAALRFNVVCRTGGFETYYQNAIQAYITDNS